MSAPGIRAYHMAQVLGRGVPGARVTLAAPAGSDLQAEPEFRVATYSRLSLLALIRRHDLVITLGFPPLSLVAWFGRSFVLDFFSNFAIEWIEVGRDETNPRRRWAWYEAQRQYINLQFTAADYITCNNERQRDFFLGVLQSLGLVTGAVYDRDHNLRRLIAACPHGIRPDPMPARDPALPAIRAHIPGIAPGDTVLLWNAGIVGWYDPVTAIRAVHALSRERPDVKLVCIGTKYPDPGFIEQNQTFKAAIETAEQLGATDKQVFFVRGWLPYAEVKHFLAQSYLGLCTYRTNAETYYAHRTRFSDLIWAELPIVCTRGDILSALIEERGLGVTVPEGDLDAVVAALRRLLDDRPFYDRCVANLRAAKAELRWEQTLAPLVEFCRRPVSVAAPKSERLLPLLRRTLGYLFWRGVAKVMR